MYKFNFVFTVTILLSSLSLTGCISTTEVKTTELTPLKFENQMLPEEELLDVGITIFDPSLDALVEEAEEDMPTFPEIRIAEARYLPFLLMETIQSTGAWGAVRIIPSELEAVDVTVKGKIIKSDGEQLIVDIDVFDSKGQRWYSKTYDEKASQYAYTTRNQIGNEPFQNLYNKIANDLLIYREKLASNELRELRLVSELKFAKRFAEQQFSAYLSQNEQGIVSVDRLPAQGEPVLMQIKQIRERDYLFIDTLQEYYSSYAKEMQPPYKQWRQESYQEVISMREMQRKATNEKMLGAVAIIAGILGAGNSDGSVRAASMIGVTAGGYLIKSGMDRSDEALIHVEALEELGDSFEASIESQVIELEDRSVTLTGTVTNQYQQWQQILKEMYDLNYGE